jgi:hypothetical protein
MEAWLRQSGLPADAQIARFWRIWRSTRFSISPGARAGTFCAACCCSISRRLLSETAQATTMSGDGAAADVLLGRDCPDKPKAPPFPAGPSENLVEQRGIEPLTSTLRTSRSPN